jgi:hypothetical protein
MDPTIGEFILDELLGGGAWLEEVGHWDVSLKVALSLVPS